MKEQNYIPYPPCAAPISGADLKSKRIAAGIPGAIVCLRLGYKSRSKLTAIERNYITPSPEELARIDVTLDELIKAKGMLQQAAAALGWPGAEAAR